MPRLADIRQRLVVLVLLVAVPLIVATVVVIDHLSDLQRQVRHEAILAQTRALTAAVDAVINRHIAVGSALATVLARNPDDLTQFYALATETIKAFPPSWVVLVDPSGQQIVNTLLPRGAPLPRITNPAIHERARATGAAQVSNLVIGPLVKRPLAGVILPVMKDGRAIYTLIISLNTDVFRNLLDDQKLPSGMAAGIIDRNGVFIARSLDHEARVGTLSSVGWRTAAAGGSEGLFASQTVEGYPYFSAFKNSALSGWSISMGASADSLYAPLRRSLWIVAAYSVVSVAVSIVLAIWAGRSIAAPMTSLQRAAAALLRGERQPIPPTNLTQVDRALEAFDSAATALLEREKQQKLLLMELDHRVKNTLAVIQSIAFLTARSATPEAFVAAFQGRLTAIAHTHDLLTCSSWASAQLADLVANEARPYHRDDVDRVRARGPAVELSPHTALSCAMALHELATNAAKYGSLSVADGYVDLRWQLLSNGEGRVVQLSWTEIGGPPVAPPTRQGFGNRVIEQVIRQEVGGSAVLHFHTAGVVCLIELPAHG